MQFRRNDTATTPQRHRNSSTIPPQQRRYDAAKPPQRVVVGLYAYVLMGSNPK